MHLGRLRSAAIFDRGGDLSTVSELPGSTGRSHRTLRFRHDSQPDDVSSTAPRNVQVAHSIASWVRSDPVSLLA